MSKEEFIKAFNNERKANKNKWYFVATANLNGHEIYIKAYKTWIQVIQYKGIKDSGPMDCTVKQMNDFLNTIIK